MNEQIIEFLTELRSHNNREWFQDNKSRYDALRKVFIDEVQDLICLLYTSPSPRD